MHLFAPDILMEGHGLHAGLSAVGLVVGLLLWVTGWVGHRFWIVLAATVLAGVVGLMTSTLYGMKPLLAGVLLAMAAGGLALALVRLIVFIAVGGATYLAVHSLAPASWDEPMGWFLVGGLAGLLLFRFWTMVLTSFIGTLLMGYSLLLLLDTVSQMDVVALCERRSTMLNVVCLSVTCVGVVLQWLLERRRLEKEREREEQLEELEYRYDDTRWRWPWSRWTRRSYRRAG